MQKILFNDMFGLTDAVLSGHKTMTRRIESDPVFFRHMEEEGAEMTIGASIDCDRNVLRITKDGKFVAEHLCRYTIGETVAIAQSYEKIYEDNKMVPSCVIMSEPGWKNKMFVKPSVMPHSLHITGIRVERLMDITWADCLEEGVCECMSNDGIRFFSFWGVSKGKVDPKLRLSDVIFNTPIEAFAHLIDKCGHRGDWESNPWVIVYEFKLER